MELARAAMGLAPERYQLSPTLMELTFGDWEGLTWPEVEARDRRRRQGARGRQMELRAAARRKLRACWSSASGPGSRRANGDCFVASHGGVARAFMFLLAGVAAAEAASTDIWQGRALIFERGGCRWVG